ncbi:MAG: sulfite dehydrogenase subunit SoeC [Chromatiaceae bacterium]
MHPAFSVLFLTTLIGAGQGLFLALYTGQFYALAQLLPAQGADFYVGGSALALGFLMAGLVASFFHLGRPERAWRTATQWRTSWLSREVIVLPAVMGLVALYGLAHALALTSPWFTLAGILPVDATLAIGLLGTLAAFALYGATAMIYASVRFLPEWHSPLTVANFLLLGLASGFLLAAAYAAWLGNELVTFFGFWAVVATGLGLVTRVASLRRLRRIKPKSSLQTAIGVRHRALIQIAQGATAGSFNTREFFHGASPATLRWVRRLFLLLVFPVPVLLLLVGHALASRWLPLAAFGVQYLGLLAERWSFFAEARHPQNLYYQGVA